MKSLFLKGLEEKLTALVEPIVAESGFELVELQLVQRKANSLLRLLIDKTGGVTIDDCALISQRVSYQLEVSDPIENRYILEVSSPGLDRPLTTPADFRRKIGETVKLTVQESGRTRETAGEIISVSDDTLTLRTEDGDVRWPLADITRGKIVF